MLLEALLFEFPAGAVALQPAPSVAPAEVKRRRQGVVSSNRTKSFAAARPHAHQSRRGRCRQFEMTAAVKPAATPRAGGRAERSGAFGAVTPKLRSKKKPRLIYVEDMHHQDSRGLADLNDKCRRRNAAQSCPDRGCDRARAGQLLHARNLQFVIRCAPVVPHAPAR